MFSCMYRRVCISLSVSEESVSWMLFRTISLSTIPTCPEIVIKSVYQQQTQLCLYDHPSLLLASIMPKILCSIFWWNCHTNHPQTTLLHRRKRSKMYLNTDRIRDRFLHAKRGRILPNRSQWNRAGIQNVLLVWQYQHLPSHNIRQLVNRLGQPEEHSV